MSREEEHLPPTRPDYPSLEEGWAQQEAAMAQTIWILLQPSTILDLF
jgi:hypothetical protein